MNKKLYRSRNDQMIAGVCAGIAEYFDLDPTIVRILFVLLAIGPVPGILVYIILAVIMPEAPAIEEAKTTEHSLREEQML
jgi:phage shock protein C